MLHVETNRSVLDIWMRSARAFESRTPGVRVEMRSMETEAFKARLPTILQSDTRPHIIYSWGGSLVDEQLRAGMLEDITDRIGTATVAAMMPAATAQLSRGGRLYGLPYNTGEIGLLINTELFARAGVAPESLREWPGLLAAVQRFKAQGIVPMAAGGQDRWPLMLPMGHVALRLGGRAAIEDALAGRNGGFANAVFLRAFELFRALCDEEPFQPGFMAMKAQPAAGLFADGRTAMFPHGTWFLRLNPTVAADRRGLPADKLAFVGFPLVPGGTGTLRETQVNLNGWLVTRNAPPAAIDFLRHFSGAETQGELAQGGFIIPANLAARERLESPIMRRSAQTVAELDFMQVAYNTLLGPSGGRVSEDIAVGLATRTMTPRDAVDALERARRQDARAG
jgi:raffinose/stachyose/melibiose transport system substrate-binding protein